MVTLFGGVEAGGTKFNCIIASGPENIVAETRIPTTTPEETLQKVIQFFELNRSSYPVSSIGIGSFGPLDLNPTSPTFGYITATPKPHWSYASIAKTIASALNLTVRIDTDVNAAALGEFTWGAAQGLDQFIYLTIGTGIGGGAMVNGKLVHGLVHPEMGHIAMPHDLSRDPYEGWCPFHKDCFEGLAAGPAIQMRWGVPASQLAVNHPAWQLEAYYIAAALQTYTCTLSPQRIILGGGVMNQQHLFPLIRREFQNMLNNYVQADVILNKLNQYIVPPVLGNRAGVLGSLALAIPQ